MDKLNLNKKVFEKRQYHKIIDTSFNQLTTQFIAPQNLPETSTVDEFFKMYNELFYDIPENGDLNSHEFLIKQSSAYINFQQENDDIQSFLDEISSLREENLKLQQTNLKLQISGSI